MKGKEKPNLLGIIYRDLSSSKYYEERIAELEEKYAKVLKENDHLRRELDYLRNYIRELEIERRELYEKAISDPLTGLMRRDYFEERVKDHLGVLKESRLYNEPFTLMFCDLDNFKKINDTHGHLIGDEVLKSVANSIRKSIRRNDYACRYGGDEFLLGLKCCDEYDAVEIMERIYKEAERELGSEINGLFSMSGGIRTIRAKEIEEPIEEFYKRIISEADEATYKSKQERNRVVNIFSENGFEKYYL